ncbi:MAG: M20/M25/M40 family metallo-hydrolase [Vicinamibacterales bacterium]
MFTRLAPLVVLAVLAVPAQPRAQAPATDLDPRIMALLPEVSEVRLAETVARLASFGTRNTMSPQDQADRGVGAARQWIFDEFQRASSRLRVSFDTYRIPPTGQRITREVEVRNVMAVLPGRSPRRVYVSGHYDTVARVEGSQQGFDWSKADNPAPGANDDGSGTALVLELARVLGGSGLDFDATIVFVAFVGEEQGLVGAKLHAQRADEQHTPIEAVFNNDIVGNATGGNGIVDAESVRVFSEGPEDSPSRQLARFIRRVAGRYVPSHRVRLIARHDRFGRGGDHTSFNQHGFTAVRITEANENYSRQHTVRDTPDGVDPAYLARNARINLAGVAALASAPPRPDVMDRGPMLDRGESGYDARLRWKPVPGAVAYRVFWREAWTPDWQHEAVVGNVTEFTMANVSIDDYIFGVAAIGAGGHESLVSAYVNPPRERVDIKTLPPQ